MSLTLHATVVAILSNSTTSRHPRCWNYLSGTTYLLPPPSSVGQGAAVKLPDPVGGAAMFSSPSRDSLSSSLLALAPICVFAMF
ncbi:hypothetical protein L1987_44753 [Smallanthus sonchifolius]|uniref:Uncharacterized protein n=1 Tax=Smallanthus sonchifolius TaxID=185202 RepID=A0ACB9GQA7_9ASTR|nr:hypothetical protein L1987_44753 [Smallanthus sonchifolius]